MNDRERTKDWIEIVPGIHRRTIAVGEKMYQMIVFLEKGAVMPPHQHVHEQIASVISGKVRFNVGGKSRDVGAAEVVMLHSNVPHGVEVLEDSWIIDTFTPIREDLLEQDRKQGKS